MFVFVFAARVGGIESQDSNFFNLCMQYKGNNSGPGNKGNLYIFWIV